MAIGFGRALATALSAGTKRLGERAVEEEEKREEMTKITLAQQLKNVEKAKADARKKQDLIDAENSAVESLKGEQVTMKDGSKRTITPAMARQAVRRLGAKEASLAILNGQIAFVSEDGGTVTAKESRRAGTLDTETVAALGEEEGAGIFGSRYKAVAKNTEAALRAMNIDPAGVDIPELAEVSGVSIVSGPANKKVENEYFYSDLPGNLMVTRRTVTDPTDPTQSENRFFNVTTGEDITDIVNSSKPKLSKSADAINNEFESFKMAIRMPEDGRGRPQTMGYEIGIKKDGTKWRQDANGDFTVKVSDSSILTLSAAEYKNFGGTDGLNDLFGRMSKDTKKQLNKFNTAAEGLEEFAGVMDRQAKLLEEHGFDLTTSVGGLNSFISRVNSEFQAGINFLEKTGEIVIGEVKDDGSIVYDPAVENQFARLERQLERDQSALDEVYDAATARRVFEANQVLLAYKYAKATGDTRISNQDFDNFIQLVSSPSVEGTLALYRERLADAAAAVESQRESLYTLAREDMGEEANTYVDNIISESRSTAAIQQRLSTSYVSTKEDLPSAADAVRRSDAIGEAASKYRVESVRIEDGKVVTGSKGSPAYAVIGPDGKPARLNGAIITMAQPQITSDPSDDANKEKLERQREKAEQAKADLQRQIARLIEEGLLQ